jgi:NRAMP (natural resistance-associated macrophage protein)-like metal ion transporter
MSTRTIFASLAAWVRRGQPVRHQGRRLRRRLAYLLAVIGPGVITSNVNNEAGGIFTYSLAGAQFGYSVLWALVPMAFALFVTEEMCARMGAVTGKGLSDLIREEFGFRVTFFVMMAVLLVNFGNVLAEFAGVASALQLFGVSKYISVPLAAIVVWVLVLHGTSRWLERIFMVLCLVYFAYVFSAFFARPHWLVALLNLLPTPVLQHVPGVRQWISPVDFSAAYLVVLAGLIGSTIAPWQHFYIQSAVVEKRIGPRQFRQVRTDVMVGTITGVVIIFFIIVCLAQTLHIAGHREIRDAADAAAGLRPLAGPWASALFALGLLNASLFAASILPLSTAYVICEGLGFESGVDRKWSEAPIFYWLYTGMIVVGAALILWPNAPLVSIAVLSQVANGILLPFVLIFILLLANRRDLMGDRVNSRTYNVLAWVTAVGMILLTLFLLYQALFVPGAARP